jgi:hypothetical protein
MLNFVANTVLYHEIKHGTKLGRFSLPTVTTVQDAVLLAYQESNNLIIRILVYDSFSTGSSKLN